ncbi:MAG: ASCH domain-containing protein [Erysipelotrichaceae bacterium]|nr:ASCH domain-containing protein [Erysipelotrichaceae bacterium]
MNANELWEKFCKEKNVDINQRHTAWAFCGGGEAGDRLAELVLERKKFGTASAYEAYLSQGALDEIPRSDEYNVILLDNGEAVCVTQNYSLNIKKFGEVSSFHGFAEGEGDRSLRYWKEVHEEFFEDDFKRANKVMDENSLIVLEQFKVVYVADGSSDEIDDIYLLENDNSVDYNHIVLDCFLNNEQVGYLEIIKEDNEFHLYSHVDEKEELFLKRANEYLGVLNNVF